MACSYRWLTIVSCAATFTFIRSHLACATLPFLDRICRESYNQPEEVYTRLKQLGMSIVTLTDHDSIDAGEVLRKYPDFFLSEEATVTDARRNRDAPGCLRNHGTRPR